MNKEYPCATWLYLLGILLCQVHSIIAQDESKYIIQKRILSVEDGLASRDVLCAAQDAQGFMWFSTSKGLQRYDGYTFQNFSYPEIKDRL